MPPPKYPKPKIVTGKNGARIQVKPDGSRYVIKKAPGKPKVVVKNKPVVGTVSQDDILKTARDRAQETFAVSRAPIVNYGKAQGQQQLGASEGLAKVLSDVSQRIQSIYGGASEATAALGQGYSGALGDTLRAADAETQAKLAQMGLPGAGGPDAAGAAQDVAYGLGGAMPAANLLKQGAGYASAAAFLPATTLQQGLAQKATTDRATQQQLAELASKYPDIFASALQSERDWKNSQFDNYTNYLNSQGGGGYGGSTAKPKITIRPDGTIVSIDPYTGVPTVTGQTTPSSSTPTTGPGSKAGAARAKAVKARNDATIKVVAAQTAWLNAQLAKAGKPVKVGVKQGLTGSVPIYKTPPKPTYKYAFNYMFNQLWLSLKRYGYKKPVIREMVDQILETQGIKPAAAPRQPYPGAR